jgi:protocatechuate 3,4-dioxygenase beta subunit
MDLLGEEEPPPRRPWRLATLLVMGILAGGLGVWWFAAERETPEPPAPCQPLGDDSWEQGRERVPFAPIPGGELEGPMDTDFDAPAAGILTLDFRWPDGSPAAEIAGVLRPRSQPIPGSRDVPFRAALDGRAEIGGLTAGSYLAHTDRSVVHPVEIPPTRDLELRIDLTPGLRVSGSVSDTEGAPIPGAEIWISEAQSCNRGMLVAHADDLGRFEIRDVHPARFVWARGGGWAPSAIQQVAEELTLTLTGPAARLRGRVVDDRGLPLRWATVQVGWYLGPQPVTGLTVFPTRTLLTDRSGAFEASDLLPGGHPILARHPGHQRSRSRIQLHAGSLTAIEIDLDTAAVLRGIVRDDRGQPLADIHVATTGSPAQETTTDQAGRFVLDEIPPGEVEVIATDRLQDRGSRSIRRALQPGEIVRWDPIL